MINKIVKTRKMHNCEECKTIIKAGTNATFISFKDARFNNGGCQIGIKFFKIYYCEICWPKK